MLTPEVFYKVVGRDDLAMKYDDALNNRHVALGLGTAAALGLMAGAVAEMVSSTHQPAPCNPSLPFDQFQACVNAQPSAGPDMLPVVGLTVGALLVGGASWIYGMSDANPVSADARRQLAKNYDAKLAKELGVPFAASDEPAKETELAINVQPEVSQSGAKLTLGVQF